ncbi:hypothetical protein SAMN05428988_0335 [Chitinophaga sp. YR573]|nr:hypothetical protein SAMN05428988_0335 [Chitinophaga sp. YR573]
MGHMLKEIKKAPGGAFYYIDSISVYTNCPNPFASLLIPSCSFSLEAA